MNLSKILLLTVALSASTVFAGGGGLGELTGTRQLGQCESDDGTLLLVLVSHCYEEGTGDYCYNDVEIEYNGKEYSFGSTHLDFDFLRRKASYSSTKSGEINGLLAEMEISISKGGTIELKENDGQTIIAKTKVTCN